MIKRKKIRYISLHFAYDNGLVNNEQQIQFNSNCRFISNYLSKEVRKLNLEAINGDINMIGVSPRKEGSSYMFEAENVLSVHPSLSEEMLARYYNTQDLESRYEFYLSLLEKGYRIAEPITGIPTASLLALHQKFRELKFRNEWLVKKMLLREYGISIILTACFTTVDYHLRLNVYDAKTKEMKTEGIIYRTTPHEVSYEKDIRKVYAQDGYLYIDDFLDRHFLQMSIIDICKGNLSAKRLLPGTEDEDEIKSLTW